MPIRVLVTGFSVFPGAPVNPSERLVKLLDERDPQFGDDVIVETVLLDTSYRTVGATLSAIGKLRHPDIALHFGLSRNARGFRLERAAKNFVSCVRPDVTGYFPLESAICEGPESHVSSLPLDAIASALTALGLPVEFSDSTGDYVCNFTFYNSRAGRFERFQPEMSGFIHIPYLDHQAPMVAGSEALPRLSEDQLRTGALAIIEACLADARTRQAPLQAIA